MESNPPGTSLSLEGMHGSVPVPNLGAGFWRKYLAFVGPALLISVGYMDPGNWGTDLAAGAQFKYQLLWVVGLSSLMAMVLQIISARLGIATGKDLAQACRDWFPAWSRWPNWVMCEIGIGACDLAEVLGSAVALNLLFHIPLLWAVFITAFDVLLLLALQGTGMRMIEAVIVVLIGTIAGCYFIELFVLPQVRPDFMDMGHNLFHPSIFGLGMISTSVAIIGATVMPHNLYLHSALVQSRKLQKDEASIRQAIRYNTLDSIIALTIAMLINGGIMVLAAMVFFGRHDAIKLADGREVLLNADADWIRVAYLTLAPLLGKVAASVLFAIALLASGQSSTITGTLAGQVVMEGFMRWRMRPWMRRMITRALAIIPAILVIGWQTSPNITHLINLSQFILALQLPFAMFPLMYFTTSRRRMGSFANGWILSSLGWTCCVLIAAMDILSLPDAWKQLN